MPPKDKMEKTTCPHCEAKNFPNSKYCITCGFEIPKAKIENITTPAEEPKATKKNSAAKYIGIAVGVGAMVAIQQFLFKAPSYDKQMMEVASELNKTCPMMVDAETRLDNAVALPENTFQYNYTLVNIEDAPLDTLGMKNYLEPVITNNIKTNPQMKIFRDNGTTLNYQYRNKQGVYLFAMSITAEEYK